MFCVDIHLLVVTKFPKCIMYIVTNSIQHQAVAGGGGGGDKQCAEIA